MNRPRNTSRHLPPCVYEKHGAYWYVKKGKWSRLGDTLAEALLEYARKVESPQGTMPALIEDVFEQHTKKLAANTTSQYRYCANELKAAFKAYSPQQVKTRHVVIVKQKHAKTPHMANRLIGFLRIVFTYAIERQLVDTNPCIGVKRYPEPRRERLVSDEEWWQIHAKADPRLQVIMELQYLTGQRITDVLSIRRSQLTEDGIEFKQQKTGTRLTVQWTPELRATVTRANTLGRTKAVTLLAGRTGNAPQYSLIRLQFAEAAVAAGVDDARLNDTRARSATTAKKQGGNPQALLGHTSPAMTERYLRDRETPVVSGPSIRQLIDKAG